MEDKKALVPLERIESRIFLIREQKVMLSTHLVELYEVEPRVLVQAVKRNIERFPHNKLQMPMNPKDEISHSPDSTHFADKLQRLLPRLLIILACATLASAIFSAATINRQTRLGLKNFPTNKAGDGKTKEVDWGPNSPAKDVLILNHRQKSSSPA